MDNKEFHFTITDLARLLGKSSVTLRGWERQGLIKFPRPDGGDRKMTATEVVHCADKAFRLGRIDKTRLHLVMGAMSSLVVIEIWNERKNK